MRPGAAEKPGKGLGLRIEDVGPHSKVDGDVDAKASRIDNVALQDNRNFNKIPAVFSPLANDPITIGDRRAGETGKLARVDQEPTHLPIAGEDDAGRNEIHVRGN